MESERVLVSQMNNLFGRQEITTPIEEITRENLLSVLGEALAKHNHNSAQISYLYDYTRGDQPILKRVKYGSRPEICNKVVENHAFEIAMFTSGYFLGEPVTYVHKGEEGNGDAVAKLNNFMFANNKAYHDKDLATWMSICGVAYRMVLPGEDVPFEIDTLDPRNTFVVYHSGFGHKRLLGAIQIRTAKGEEITCGYTKDFYFEVGGDEIRKWERHTIGHVPIIEYKLNMLRMGSFEPALPLLDKLNTMASNRLDGVEQFVQSFLKFKNCDIDKDGIDQLKTLGAIVIKTVNGLDGDVDVVAQELNQMQVQSLVDYIYDQVLTISAMPTTKKGGTSTSDTGAAVILRDGWEQCEARAKDTEPHFVKSEKEFLQVVFSILDAGENALGLNISQVDCKFTRRQHDALLVKTQALQNMLTAGIAPPIAIASSGLFNDPMDVAAQSEEYLAKWKPTENQPVAQDDIQDEQSE